MRRWWRRLAGAALEVAGVVAGARRVRIREEDVLEQQWRDSVQRMGVRFTERIRDAWRSRWLRVHRGGDGER